MGSTSDEHHAKKITDKLDDYGVSWEQHAASAHKQPLKVLEILNENKDKELVLAFQLGGDINDGDTDIGENGTYLFNRNDEKVIELYLGKM